MKQGSNANSPALPSCAPNAEGCCAMCAWLSAIPATKAICRRWKKRRLIRRLWFRNTPGGRSIAYAKRLRLKLSRALEQLRIDGIRRPLSGATREQIVDCDHSHFGACPQGRAAEMWSEDHI